MTRITIAIEGIDGSGKATVAGLLQERLAARCGAAELYSFPRYNETAAARLIADLLNGRLAPPTPAYAAAMFAMDRAEFFASGRGGAGALVFDRFTMSNVAFQTARLAAADRAALAEWIVDFEFNRLNVPRPDLTVLLDVSEAAAAKFLQAKGRRSYTDEKLDAYEADRRFQSDVRSVYLDLADRQFGGPWLVVPVAPGEEPMLTPDQAADQILAQLSAEISRASG